MVRITSVLRPFSERVPRHQAQMMHNKSILLEKYSSDHDNEDIVRLRIHWRFVWYHTLKIAPGRTRNAPLHGQTNFASFPKICHHRAENIAWQWSCFLSHSVLYIIIFERLDRFWHTLYQQLRLFNLFNLHTWKLKIASEKAELLPVEECDLLSAPHCNS